MIPSKLYIPTTTLNFNNIMASESISPAGFYSMRGFGYKRFDKVEPNNLDKRIILYEKYPLFNINDNELENYPLVIEIDTKSIVEDIIQEYKNGVYYSEETIYLNPFSTQIIFNNETEKRRTLSKGDQSLNTKMVLVYQNRIIVKTPKIKTFEWKPIDLTDSKSDFSKYISKDRKINKLKGFLYAYVIGVNKSLSPETVTLKKHAKELENVLSAIITNSDNRATYLQEEKLKKIYLSIHNAFLRADGKIQSVIKQKVDQYKCENFIDILRFEGVLDYWYQKQNIKPQFQITQFNISYSSSPDEKQKALDFYISNLANAINKIIVSKNIEVKELPILQHNSRVESIQKNNFLPKLFNEFLAENWNSEEFISDRLEFATTGGKLFKEELQDKWENSSYKTYINDLRNNLASHTSFSLQNTDNLTLKSFAAFCQKGEEDIDKLEDYLISNEIGDFRIAFALWGMVFGFANTPKTLTHSLFLSLNLDYISHTYKYIFKQIHGIELDGTFDKKQETETLTISSKINEYELPVTTKKDDINENRKSIALEVYQKLEDKIKSVKSDKAIYIDYISEYGLTEQLLNAIKNDKRLSKGKGAPKNVISFFDKEYNPQKTKSSQDKVSKDNSSIGLDFPPEKEFYLDDNAWNHISNFEFKDKKVKDKIKKNLHTIQIGYRQGGFYYKRGDSTENKKVIDHFLAWNITEKNKYDKISKNDFPEELKEKIRFTLEKIYPS